MMDSRLPFDEGRAFHFMMGRPDDDCEICRLHGLTGHGTDQDGPSLIVTEIRDLSELLACPCPLCNQMIRNSPPGAGRRRPSGETP